MKWEQVCSTIWTCGVWRLAVGTRLRAGRVVVTLEQAHPHNLSTVVGTLWVREADVGRAVRTLMEWADGD